MSAFVAHAGMPVVGDVCGSCSWADGPVGRVEATAQLDHHLSWDGTSKGRHVRCLGREGDRALRPRVDSQVEYIRPCIVTSHVQIIFASRDDPAIEIGKMGDLALEVRLYQHVSERV